MKKSARMDSLVAGFALFSMFFGAGNLIFPPDLGLRSGKLWWLGFLFYFAADIGLSILAILAMLKKEGRPEELTAPLGKLPSKLIITCLILCIGPFLAIPRTAATTYELGLLPLLGTEASTGGRAVFSAVFFVITFFLSVRPGKVVDIIGKFLTPCLLLSLLVLILKGTIRPGAAPGEPITANVFHEGIANGYQTMDMIGAIFLSIIILRSIRERGYRGYKAVNAVAFRAALIAAVLLFLIYGGLTRLGAYTGSIFREEVVTGQMNQAGLLATINHHLLGSAGTVILSVIVASACVTTAVGLTSAAGAYFEKLLQGRLSYSRAALLICIVSAAVCNLGLSAIIGIAAPILTLLYPLTILMTVCVFLQEKIPGVLPCRVAAAVALGISFLEMLGNTFGISACAALAAKLPFSSAGLGWLLPTLLALAVSAEAVRFSSRH